MWMGDPPRQPQTGAAERGGKTFLVLQFNQIISNEWEIINSFCNWRLVSPYLPDQINSFRVYIFVKAMEMK